jgi:hypothetical protein
MCLVSSPKTVLRLVNGVLRPRTEKRYITSPMSPLRLVWNIISPFTLAIEGYKFFLSLVSYSSSLHRTPLLTRNSEREYLMSLSLFQSPSKLIYVLL